MTGTIGLLALAGTILAACGTAVALAVIPHVRERRRSVERAAFLRAQLLHQLEILPSYLQERDRALSLDQRDILDVLSGFVQQAHVLEVDEWDCLLRVHAILLTARNRPSYSKREARIAQQLVQHAKTILHNRTMELHERRSWKHLLVGTRRRTLSSAVDPSLKLRQTAW